MHWHQRVCNSNRFVEARVNRSPDVDRFTALRDRFRPLFVESPAVCHQSRPETRPRTAFSELLNHIHSLQGGGARSRNMRREAFHKDQKHQAYARVREWSREIRYCSAKGLSSRKETTHRAVEVRLMDTVGCSRPLTYVEDILGRVCMEFGSNGTTLSCCLPCPVVDWIYSDDFGAATRSTNTMAIIALVLEAFILLTHVALPKEEHNRDYSNVGLTISLAFVAIAFVTPLGTNPEPCHNAITPNDFRTDTTCAISGFFLEFGSMGSVVWSRSLLTASLRFHADNRCSPPQIHTDRVPHGFRSLFRSPFQDCHGFVWDRPAVSFCSSIATGCWSVLPCRKRLRSQPSVRDGGMVRLASGLRHNQCIDSGPRLLSLSLAFHKIPARGKA